MRNNKGFSLVELIVVIAIMAVLAAVAVIGVSIYIPKAQQAADNELLNVLGDALRTACLSEGVDPSTITATIAVDAEGKLAAKADGTVDLRISGTSKQDKLLELFNQIFTEKNAVTKKPMGNQLEFDGKTFAWNNGTNNPTISYGGGTIVLDQKDIDALKDSVFGDIGVGKLLNQLDQVSGIAANLVAQNAGSLGDIVGDIAFQKQSAEILGIDTTQSDWLVKYNDECTRLIEDYIVEHGLDRNKDFDFARSQVQANALVLYTAQQTTNMSRDDIDEFLANPSQQEIINNLSDPNKSDTGLAQAGLMCGLYTSFVHSEYGKNVPEEKRAANVENVLDALATNAEFIAYVKDKEKSQNDVNGYLGSLNMIYGSTGDKEAVGALIVNGFGDKELAEKLDQSIGN